MKKNLLLLIFTFLVKTSFSQTYSITRGLAVAEITTPTTGVTAITALGDDNFVGPFNIGFNFNFYTTTYTQFYIGSNGVISFGSGQNGSFGNAQPTNPNAITFAGADLDCRVSASPSALVNYFVSGVSPNRKLVVNFKNIAHYDNNSNISNVQIQLLEGSSNIELHISNVQSAPGYMNRCIGVCNSTSTVFTTQASINGVNTVNVVNEMIRFQYSLPECVNTINITKNVSNDCNQITTLTTSINPNGAFGIEWYKNGVLQSGLTNSTSITATTGSYYVKIINANCSKISSTIIVNETPVPNIIGNNCVGSVLTACGFGNNTIQWYKDGVSISGATANTYVPTQPGNYTVKSGSSSTSWVSQTLNQSFKSFHFSDSNTGWAISSNGTQIYKTTNSGITWTLQYTVSSPSVLNKIYSLSNSVVIAIGNSRVLLRTSDGGSNWNPISVSDQSAFNFYDIAFINSSTGWMGANGGAILKTIDGGITWTSTFALTYYDFVGWIGFKNASIGYLVSLKSPSIYTLYKTTNGGTNWTEISNVLIQSPNEIWNMNGIYVSPNLNLGYIYGSTKVPTALGAYFIIPGLVALDNGFSNTGGFFDINSGESEPNSIAFINATQGWGTFGNKIKQTTNGGTNFTNEVVQGGDIDSYNIKIQVLENGTAGWAFGGSGSTKFARFYNISTPVFSVAAICQCLNNISLMTGSWGTAGVWSCGHVPLATEPVQISAGHTITLDVNGAVKSLDLRGILNKQATKVLTIRGN
jgi:hypothetical protein